jgi:hypothetical protein
MQEFMFFIRKESDHEATLNPEQHKLFLKGCEHYIEELKKDGRLLAAQPIERKGVIIGGNAGGWAENPFNEGREVIGGYYHILANDLDEAISIAKRNPEFAFPTGARIEVRPVKMKEQSTGFVYPKYE